MHLVIVESPTKARTIGRFLGKDYHVVASMGHLMDLPKSKLGVDIEHEFQPEFALIAEKNAVISELQKLAKGADEIILATDPDREGEAIAAHVAQLLDGGKNELSRIVFHEITKDAIEEALQSPRKIDKNLVEAQVARRVLDRLVGYKLSPVLWQKVRRGLSAGRVQSVAVRLIVEREREIEKFKKEPYYTIHVQLMRGSSSPPQAPVILVSEAHPGSAHDSGQVVDPVRARMTNGIEFDLVEINGERIESQQTYDLYDGQYRVSKTSIATVEDAKKIVTSLLTKQFVVLDILQKETKRTPPPPFTTSTLQQEAARRFGYSGKRTMSLAQKLYEEGFITYHRTDSVNLSASAVTTVRGYIKSEFGEKYIPESPRFYKTKQKLAQEAHEAIRPTKVDVASQVVSQDLGKDYAKVYELIWRRFVACQMSEAITESTTVTVEAVSHGVILSEAKDLDSSAKPQNDKSAYTLKAVGSVLVFDGFLKVNPSALEDKRLPQFTSGENLSYVSSRDESHETLPPPRYNDASLIRTLEEKGIGRPSTYASITATIQDRRYVEKQENRFIPTSVGVAVNDFLVTNFADIDDVPFTADMEDSLDAIANGEKEFLPMMKEFYKPFEKQLAFVKDAKRVKIEVELTNEKCEKCGEPLVIRIGKFGKFLSCSTFPKCDFSKPFVEETGMTCPKCGRRPDAVQKDSVLEEGSAPAGGKVIVKRTRKGRRFYGCSNYPKCDFAAWKLEDIGKTTQVATQTKVTNKKPTKK